MNAYQRGNRDGLLAFAAWAREMADVYRKETDRRTDLQMRTMDDNVREEIRKYIGTMLWQITAFQHAAREAERMAEALPMDPEEVEPYKPSWVGDSRGYDQARENPPVVVDGVTISVVRREHDE